MVNILTALLVFVQYICIMNIIRIAIELFALYLLYKVVFDLIIPVAKTTKQVKKQFSDMHSRMQEQANQQTYRDNHTATKEKKASSDEYIDYEEIK